MLEQTLSNYPKAPEEVCQIVMKAYTRADGVFNRIRNVALAKIDKRGAILI